MSDKTDLKPCPDCDGTGIVLEARAWSIVCCGNPNRDGSCCGNGLPGMGAPEPCQCERCQATGKVTSTMTDKPNHENKITMEYGYDLKELHAILPAQAKTEITAKKGHIAIEVKIVPALAWQEHDPLVKKIVELYGEDLMEVYTETEGYHFIIYLHRSKVRPTVISF